MILTNLKSIRTQIIDHLSIPLFRNGYALVSSAALTSGLGMLYWIVAARQYSQEVLGINSALIAMMIFIASIAQLDMAYVVNRFLPKAGNKSVQFILYTYSLTTILAFFVSTIFVFGSQLWSPTLHQFFKANPFTRWWFIAGSVAWCIFALQDNVMTGLRQATWVPLENLLFSLGKLALLILLATRLALVGVFGSWILMVFVLLLPMNLLIFKKLIPNYLQNMPTKTQSFSYREIGRFVVGNYFASLFWWSATDLLPLLVVELISSEANATFYLSWTIAYSLYLVSRNMGMSLITEGARDEKMLMVYSKKVLIQNGRIIFLALLFILPFSGPILRLFGQAYAAEGVWVLRLLCLSALPNIVTTLYSSIVRVQKRLKALLALYASICLLVLVTSILLLPRVGIIGGGIAWLVAQTGVAVVLLLTELRPIWLAHFPIQKLKPLISIWVMGSQYINNRNGRNIIQSALKKVDSDQWRFKKTFPTVGDTVVGLIEASGNGETAVIKVATSPFAEQSIQHHHFTVEKLLSDPKLKQEAGLFPRPILIQNQNLLSLIEEQKIGVSLSTVLTQATIDQQWDASFKAIATVHQASAQKKTVTETMLKTWLGTPFLNIFETVMNEFETLEWLCEVLLPHFQSQLLTVSLIHGDYCPSNILYATQINAVSGILDWERAIELGLPEIDYCHLWLTAQMTLHKMELGQLIINEFKQPTFDLGAYQINRQLGKRPLLLLTWLWHVNSNLVKANRFKNNPIWVKNNISVVLEFLEHEHTNGGIQL